MPTRSWIGSTGQIWKLGLFYFMMLTTVALIVAFILAVNGATISNFAGRFELAISFVLLGVVSLVWLSLSIRCPKCGSRPVWRMLRTVDINSWLVKLHTMNCCPECKQ
jgi:hypothetical protein